MNELPHCESVHTFDLSGNMKLLRVVIGNGKIRIVSGRKNLSIPEESLLKIEHSPDSWRFGASGPGLRIRFVYRTGLRTRSKKAEIALAADDPRTFDFIDHLKKIFPDQSCMAPNDREKERVLSAGWRGVYALHSLHILTPAGIVLGILLACVLITTIILAESMPVRTIGILALQQVRLVFLTLAAFPAAIIILVLAKKWMTLRTDNEFFTVRRLFICKKFAWRDVAIGEARSDAFNVYTGLFCYYSDQVNVVSSRLLVAIPLLHGERVETTLRMNLEEAAPLLRELYYRGKVKMETAEKAGAFI